MKCEWVQENAALYLYDEMADDERYEAEQHLAKCADCARELEGLRELHSALSAVKVEDPSPNMVAQARMLQEALESAHQDRGWSRFTLDIAGWMQQIRFSPALAMVLLMVGFGGGILASFRTAVERPLEGAAVAATDSASIAAIRGISQNPQTNSVEIKYDKLVPDMAQGSLNDPKIQQLLLYAARNNYNSGVRLDSIDVLTQKPEDAQIREALIFALRYDKNPGIRLKALAGLKAYVKTDVRVRDVMLEALLRDANEGVRAEAIRSLQPVIADSSVRATLQALAEKDSNKFIRFESRRVLAALPDIE